MAQENRKLNDIVQDQTRLRANLREMPPTAEAYKRYLKKFDDQETEIESTARPDQEAAGPGTAAAARAIDAYLAKLDVE